MNFFQISDAADPYVRPRAVGDIREYRYPFGETTNASGADLVFLANASADPGEQQCPRRPQRHAAHDVGL